MSKKSILITGGCGYIGSHTVIEFLRQTDLEVISIDNHLNSTPTVLDRIKKITGKSIKNYEVDLRNLTDTEAVFVENPGISGVIHFAALKSVPDSVANPEWYYDNNINSLLNILACCKKFKVNNFIFSSSCSVYGNVQTLPVSESTPLEMPESPYAHTKRIGEEIIKISLKDTAVKSILLRYFNPVGADKSGLNGELPNGKPNNLIPVITQVAAGIMDKLNVFGFDYDTRDGSCVRDYVHVTDIANAHLKAFYCIDNGDIDSDIDIINLGTGKGVTVLEAISTFEKVCGVKLNYEKVPRRLGDVAAIYSDCTKAKKVLQWEALHSTEEMMSSAWKWQQFITK
jgi:UDP-glucose 4-epimerase